MAANTNVLGSDAIETQLADEVNNPDRGDTHTNHNRKIVHLTLVVDGVALDMGDLFDAIDDMTGVELTGEKSFNARNTYIWNLGPA